MNPEREKSKKREQCRHLYRAACNLLLLAAEAGVFYLIWMRFYNPNFRNPYVFRGNIFAACVYAVLLLLMRNFYGGLKLGYHRSFNIIFGLSLTAVLTNIAAYFIVILQAATWYLSPVPAVIYMSIIDIAVVIVWGLVFNRLFRHIFPPNRLVLIAGTGADELKAKFAGRSDRYMIADTIIIPGCDIYGDSRHKGFHRTSAAVLMGTDEPDEKAQKRNAAQILHKKFYDGLENYDGVVVGDLTAELRNDILKNCYSRGIRTYTLPKITDVILKSSETMAVFDSPLFLNRNSGLSAGQALAKRISDIVMSLVGLIIAAPFMLIIAAAIKAEDHGPVFFRQQRCTEGGRVFSILKFRSMIVNAEQSGISVPATEKDPRITGVGRIIRATRLDELPQLINILLGDMSVVGPRPERIEHVREYCEDIPEFKYRMSVKGGLTGYAQVYGKYNTSAYDKLKLDLLYIQNYSIMLDLEIILKTVQVLFTKESTEGFDKKKSESLSEASRRHEEENKRE